MIPLWRFTTLPPSASPACTAGIVIAYFLHPVRSDPFTAYTGLSTNSDGRA